MGDIYKIRLLAHLIRDFREYTGRSVNYVCFLYNYFKEQELCDWPGKTKILEKLQPNLPKSFKSWLKVIDDYNDCRVSINEKPYDELEDDWLLEADPLFWPSV